MRRRKKMNNRYFRREYVDEYICDDLCNKSKTCTIPCIHDTGTARETG